MTQQSRPSAPNPRKSSMANLKPSKVRPPRHYAAKTCAHCEASFIPTHSGTRYCSRDCFLAARRNTKGYRDGPTSNRRRHGPLGLLALPEMNRQRE